MENGDVLNKILYKGTGYDYEKLLFINFVGPPSTILVDRSVFNDVGYFDESLEYS